MKALQTVEIAKLVRTSDPHLSALQSVQRLVHVVAEWDPRSGPEIVFHSVDRSLVLSLTHRGHHQEGWVDEVAWAL